MVWVIGDKGMLGTELSLALEKAGLGHVGSDREVDITDRVALEGFAEGKRIKWMANCAAYTAEDEPELCQRLNVEGAAEIAKLAERMGAGLIHISTDYVFDGNGERPYREDDETNPAGVYGRTKRDGELEVLKNCKNSFVMRTAWLYGRHGSNFVHTMVRLMNERESVRVVDDQRGSPTWAKDFAEMIAAFIRVADSGKNMSPGVYHYTNEGDVTWREFAQAIYEEGRRLGVITKDCAVIPCATEEYPTKARRPAYSVLDKTKIKDALGMKAPEWKASLRKFLSEWAP
ncbi:MAG: dTDP-4-dehydrorhamnose reductase [Treponema sp.]|jgi:dTDP-4-dehydrorhamnose reductase|nr:dTDP-4-dehydrorhamnose reductase [Treponema sp.]